MALVQQRGFRREVNGGANVPNQEWQDTYETIVRNEFKEGNNTCEFTDDDDCIFYFTYDYDDNNELKIIAQETKECPTKVNVLAIVLGVVIGIVLVGLALLLIWKLVTTINDRRELARFDKETKDDKWDTGENPVYKPATSTYKNPAYAGR